MRLERVELKIRPTQDGVAVALNPGSDSGFRKRRYLLIVPSFSRFVQAGLPRGVAMIDTITVLFGLFSAGIFLAHAFDGYRSRASSRERDHA
jgi:hypothetical protein